jgi:hypothetical protein
MQQKQAVLYHDDLYFLNKWLGFDFISWRDTEDVFVI